MESFRHRYKTCFLFVVIALLLMLFGCAHDVRKPMASLDTPEHHAFSGLKLLQKMRYDDAQREFEMALELDPKYSQAHYGLGLVLGHKKNFKKAFKSMARAKRYSKGKDERASAFVGFMRLHTLQNKKEWLDEVEKNYYKVVATAKDMPEAHYYMGVAYKSAYRFKAAEKKYTKVLEINKTLVKEADRELKLVQKVQRAMPGSVVGKKLALRDKTSRADVAAIFVHELQLDKMYAKMRKLDNDLHVYPKDITDHPLKTDITTILRIGLKGLEVFPDGSFNPDHFITRAEFAMMVEDIIGTITYDKKLAVKFIGSPSPFNDVRSDAPYLNAVMVCTTRGLMEAENMIDGEFNPKGQISGADTLLVIRKLKEK